MAAATAQRGGRGAAGGPWPGAGALRGGPTRPGCAPGLRAGRAVRAVRARAGELRKITGEELEVAVQDRAKPMVVDFYADWCGPCVVMAQELEKCAAQWGEAVDFVKIDTDADADIATALNIQGLPTLLFIATDKEAPVRRCEGLLPAETVNNLISEIASAPGQ